MYVFSLVKERGMGCHENDFLPVLWYNMYMENKKTRAQQQEYDRSAGGSFDLSEGDGDLMFMDVLGAPYNCMEAFKAGCFWRMRLPEKIDPEGKCPNLRAEKKLVEDYGYSNVVISRIYIQSAQMLKWVHFKEEDDLEKKKVRAASFDA